MVLQYIIVDIQEEVSNKIVLYGARTYAEFKEKVKFNERIKQKVGSARKHKSNTKWRKIKRKKDMPKTHIGVSIEIRRPRRMEYASIEKIKGIHLKTARTNRKELNVFIAKNLVILLRDVVKKLRMIKEP